MAGDPEQLPPPCGKEELTRTQLSLKDARAASLAESGPRTHQLDTDRLEHHAHTQARTQIFRLATALLT